MGPAMRSTSYTLARHLDLFRSLPDAQVQDVLAQARVRTVDEGAPVFAQGAPALRFFLLVEGRLKVMQASPEGRQIIAHWIDPGQFFGLAVALGRNDYPGTALAATRSTILAWPSASWAKLAALHPPLAEAALRTLGGHLQDAFARLREVAAMRVERRIASALLRLLRSSGQHTRAGLQIAFPITRQDIAEMAATTLYTVSRTFSSWENAGVLAVGRRRVVVVNPQMLMRLAGEERGEARTSGSEACRGKRKVLHP